MPSKDTIPFRITRKSFEELERIRKVISKELGIDVHDISLKKAEIVMREKAKNGRVTQETLKDILLGKIK